MPPKQSSAAGKRLAASTVPSSKPKSKLTQNKLTFASQSTRTLGSRPLTFTPSFSLPDSDSPLPPSPEPGAFQSQSDKGSSVNGINASTSSQSRKWASSPRQASLWSEGLAPVTADELAVHPRKVQDVRRWLIEALEGDASQSRYRKILTLTGPAGSGKSAVIRALASTTELNYQLLEWSNDTVNSDLATYQPGSSFIERFADFLQKGSKFPSLDVQSDQHPSESVSSSSKIAAKPRRIIVIEDLPNIHHLPTRQLFQAALEQFIDQSTSLSSRGLPNVPVVLIVTECTPRDDQDRWMGDSSGSAWRDRLASIMDSRTALSERIRQHPAHTEIRFNPVAPTILVSGLKRALELQASKIGKFKMGALPLDVLQAIAQDSSGDIRAAVNCLQFACANTETSPVRRQKAWTAVERKKMLRNLMPLISGRGSSLALFHAIGRVLYNKRVGDPGGEDEQGKDKRLNGQIAIAQNDCDDDEDDNISAHEASTLKKRLALAMNRMGVSSQDDESVSFALPQSSLHLDRRTSRVDIDQLWGDLPVDASVFQMYLHQNYPPFTTELDECESIIESISTADAFCLSQDHYRHSSLLSYYSFFITVQGTLLGLPSPVPRRSQKLGKATYWDVQKKLRQQLDTLGELKSWLGSSADHVYSLSNGGSFNGADRASAESRYKRVKFTNQTMASQSESGDFDRVDAGLGDMSRSWMMKCDALALATEVLPLLSKIQPDELPKDLAKSARMRFEYAGVSDLALRTLGEHDLAPDREEEGETTLQTSSNTVHPRASLAVKPLVSETKMYLSEDDIDEF